jgi:hypothetical protein
MKFTVFPLAAFALAACRTSPSIDREVEFRSLVRGYQSGITGPDACVARTEIEWRDLWSRHASLAIPRADAPAVDFEHDMVLYVSLGPRPTYGYAVEIQRIVPVDAEHLKVEVTETRPAPDAITNQVVTQPYHMVVTARRPGAIEIVPR